MTTPLVQLKPCPGCGSSDTRVIGGPGTRGGPQHWAGCDHCHWRTWGDTEHDAITAWNTRAAEALAGRAEPDRDMAMHWIDRYAAGIDETCQLDRVIDALTPSRAGGGEVGDALAVLVAWINRALVPNYTDRKPMPENLRKALEQADAALHGAGVRGGETTLSPTGNELPEGCKSTADY